MNLSTQDKTRLSNQVRQEYKAGLLFRHDRERTWKEVEDQYHNKVKKSLKNRYNVPIPIVSGFVETLLSKIDDPPTIEYEQGEESDYKAVNKLNAFVKQEAQSDDYDWDMVDLDGKKIATLYGRAVTKNYGKSNPFQFCIEAVDVYDFIADPIGGGNLENHRFAMQDNIFKTREELKDGVAKGWYDIREVERLINSTGEDQLVDNDTELKSKQSRFMSLGLDGITHNYAGQALYKLVEAVTQFNGVRMYVLFNRETGVLVAAQPLVERFKSNLLPWTSWATHRDIFNFWSKAPVDDILPLADMARILLNQELDNRLKRNFNMRAYDPEMFPNAADLVWRPDGLVATKSGASKLQQIGSGIYQFETAELNGTINLVQYIDSVIGQKSGVTADAQGSSDEDKVGIYFGNLQQVADRMGLYNKSYKKEKQAIGRRFAWACFEHIRSPEAVSIIGERGQEWDEIKRIEVNPKWNVIVKGGSAELQADEVKKKRLAEVMSQFAPDELMVMSPKWRAEMKLRIGGVEEEDIRMAFDLESDGNKEILSEASMAIQQILDGKQPKTNRGANTAFVQKILDYATDTDLKQEEYEALIAYAQAHIPIAQENMARKAVQTAAQKGIPPTQLGVGGETPAPNTPAGTTSQVGEMNTGAQLSPSI